MTPLFLPSAVSLVADVAGQILDANISEHDAAWILSTALIIEALRRAKGNKCKAARMLGIHRNTFNRQLEEVGGLEPFIQDVKKSVRAQLKLFGRKKLANSCTAAHSLPTSCPQFLQRNCA